MAGFSNRSLHILVEFLKNQLMHFKEESSIKEEEEEREYAKEDFRIARKAINNNCAKHQKDLNVIVLHHNILIYLLF